jgi:hypothetical protein
MRSFWKYRPSLGNESICEAIPDGRSETNLIKQNFLAAETDDRHVRQVYCSLMTLCGLKSKGWLIRNVSEFL